MGNATVVFTEMGSLMGSRFPEISDFEDEQLDPESIPSQDIGFEDIVGKSPALQRVLKQVAIVAPTNATVLTRSQRLRAYLDGA